MLKHVSKLLLLLLIIASPLTLHAAETVDEDAIKAKFPNLAKTSDDFPSGSYRESFFIADADISDGTTPDQPVFISADSDTVLMSAVFFRASNYSGEGMAFQIMDPDSGNFISIASGGDKFTWSTDPYDKAIFIAHDTIIFEDGFIAQSLQAIRSDDLDNPEKSPSDVKTISKNNGNYTYHLLTMGEGGEIAENLEFSKTLRLATLTYEERDDHLYLAGDHEIKIYNDNNGPSGYRHTFTMEKGDSNTFMWFGTNVDNGYSYICYAKSDNDNVITCNNDNLESRSDNYYRFDLVRAGAAGGHNSGLSSYYMSNLGSGMWMWDRSQCQPDCLKANHPEKSNSKRVIPMGSITGWVNPLLKIKAMKNADWNGPGY